MTRKKRPCTCDRRAGAVVPEEGAAPQLPGKLVAVETLRLAHEVLDSSSRPTAMALADWLELRAYLRERAAHGTGPLRRRVTGEMMWRLRAAMQKEADASPHGWFGRSAREVLEGIT